MLSYQLSSTSNIARLKIESLNLMLSQELIINHYFFFKKSKFHVVRSLKTLHLSFHNVILDLLYNGWEI